MKSCEFYSSGANGYALCDSRDVSFGLSWAVRYENFSQNRNNH